MTCEGKLDTFVHVGGNKTVSVFMLNIDMVLFTILE